MENMYVKSIIKCKHKNNPMEFKLLFSLSHLSIRKGYGKKTTATMPIYSKHFYVFNIC